MRHLRALGLACLALSAAGAAQAGVSRLCDGRAEVSAGEQDRLLRFAAVVKQVLETSNQRVALISRTGLDLSRLGIRYSHAGIALKPAADGAWSVRQLYYACEESRARLFDEGVAGFLLGTHDPASGFISIVHLPAAPSAALQEAALDKRRALQLLGETYSANAYAFNTRYQNCNQWVMEMLASAWAPPQAAPLTREEAQRWLRQQAYDPAPVHVGSHGLMFAAQFLPFVHVADHPVDDLQALRLRVSMPAAIEVFARQQQPGAERVELCHNSHHIVVRRGWDPIGPECRAAAADLVIPLDS
jgi:hypothetical protein